MIKKKELVSFTGLMEESMMESGIMANNTELEHILQPQVKQSKVNGMKVKELNG